MQHLSRNAKRLTFSRTNGVKDGKSHSVYSSSVSTPVEHYSDDNVFLPTANKVIHQGHSMQLSDLLSLIWFKLTQVFLGYIFFKYQTYSPLCRIYWFWETTWSSEKKIRSLKGGLFRRHAVHCSPYFNRHGYVYSHPNHISSSQSIFTSIFHCFK